MRELGFSVLWTKLAKPVTTTFRFTRRDRDWEVGEEVKIVFKPRSKKDRSVLGVAEIINKEPRWIYVSEHPNLDFSLAKLVTEKEAQMDGFESRSEMLHWMGRAYGSRLFKEPMNKLTLSWTKRFLYTFDQKPHVMKQWAELLR